MLPFIRLDALKRPDVDCLRKAEVETKQTVARSSKPIKRY